MRVATYTQPDLPTRGSLFALLMLLATLLLGTGMLPSVASYLGGSLTIAITPLWLLLYLGAAFGLMFKHGINWISWLVRYRILLVLLMLGTMVSVGWSIDARVSAERTVHLLGSTLIAIYIGFSIPLLTTLRITAVVLGFLMMLSIAAALALPDLGIEAYEGSQVWRGVFNSKNDLGFWAGVGVLLYMTLSDSTHTSALKLLCFLLAGICLGILVFSQSATSLLAMLVAGAISLYMFIANRFELGFFRMVFVAVLLMALLGIAITNIETTELVGRTDDLTGRGEVWRQTWNLITERPLTGYGYGSLWFPTDDTLWIQQSLTDFTWVVYHAHNGFLHLASEIGLPLALLALLMVAQQLIEIFYCQYQRQQVGVLFVLAFVVAFLLSNFSEARFLISKELFWIFFLALPISMLRQINLISTEGLDGTPDTPSSPYPGVPGKPWLGPFPSGTPSSRPISWAAPSAGAAMALPVGSATAGMAMPTGHAESADADDFDESLYIDDMDATASTLSLTEADIDLGAESSAAEAAKEQTELDGDLDESIADLRSRGTVVTLVDAVTSEASADFKTLFDDVLDIDRYDKDLDVTGEWVDVLTDDERKVT